MPTHNAPRAAHPLRAVLSLRDFRLLFASCFLMPHPTMCSVHPCSCLLPASSTSSGSS
jgi:hypothetical protein